MLWPQGLHAPHSGLDFCSSFLKSPTYALVDPGMGLASSSGHSSTEQVLHVVRRLRQKAGSGRAGAFEGCRLCSLPVGTYLPKVKPLQLRESVHLLTWRGWPPHFVKRKTQALRVTCRKITFWFLAGGARTRQSHTERGGGECISHGTFTLQPLLCPSLRLEFWARSHKHLACFSSHQICYSDLCRPCGIWLPSPPSHGGSLILFCFKQINKQNPRNFYLLIFS